MANKLLVVIGGPTGVGKTEVAIQLALHYHSEIISADSRQVYQELIIGVGRPTAAQRTAVPHHLIGHTSIFSHYSVGHFVEDALAILQQLFHHHDIVFLTGGTGLYVKAIMEGLDEIPEVPDEVNGHWIELWKENGINYLLEALSELDPVYLETVDQSNPMRLIRALAVSEHSGKPFSSFRKGETTTRPFRILPIVLNLPREELYTRINQRVLTMMENGWMEEAKTLYPHRHLKALQTVGYKELFDCIEGTMALDDAITAIQQSTRRYAKRQMTWWRNQGEWHSYSPEHVNQIIQAIDHELEAWSKEHGAWRKE